MSKLLGWVLDNRHLFDDLSHRPVVRVDLPAEHRPTTSRVASPKGSVMKEGR